MSDIVDRLRKRVVTRWVHAVGSTPRSSGYSPDRECHEAADEIARLRAENEALRADAERYRLWRQAFVSPRMADMRAALGGAWTPEAVDAALDAAIDAAKGGANG